MPKTTDPEETATDYDKYTDSIISPDYENNYTAQANSSRNKKFTSFVKNLNLCRVGPLKINKLNSYS